MLPQAEEFSVSEDLIHSFIWDAKAKSELDWHVCAEPSF